MKPLILSLMLFASAFSHAIPISGFSAKEYIIKCKGYPNPVKTSLFLSPSISDSVDCQWKEAEGEAAPGAEGDFDASFTMKLPAVLSIKTANYQISQPNFQFNNWRSNESIAEKGCASFTEFHFLISDGKNTYNVALSRPDNGISIWSGTTYGIGSPLCEGAAKSN